MKQWFHEVISNAHGLLCLRVSAKFDELHEQKNEW